jgi:hypothetical protein
MNPTFVLMDFSCGRFYTHHSSYLKDYADFLSNKGYKVKICVNASADDEVIQLFSEYDFTACLKSSNYGVDWRKNIFRFIEDRFYQFLFRILESINVSENVIEFFKKILSRSYLKTALKYLENENLSSKEIRLVFPTTDSFSFRLIERLSNSLQLNISQISVRITGAEKRGIFGVQDSEIKLLKLKELKALKLSIGLETNNYKEKFIIYDPNFIELLDWAPMPYIDRNSQQIGASNGILQIGFLGSARKGKGFEDIPEILRIFTQYGISFHATIQLPIFKWEKSEKIINKVKTDFEHNVTWLKGGISKNEIELTISKMDWIFLPYNQLAYEYAGSGIMFLAADLKVPIITNEKVAFAWDLETFGIGITYEKYKDAILNLKKTTKNSLKSQINSYNSARNSANSIFLNL